jgi:hypothetical protein
MKVTLSRCSFFQYFDLKVKLMFIVMVFHLSLTVLTFTFQVLAFDFAFHSIIFNYFHGISMEIIDLFPWNIERFHKNYRMELPKRSLLSLTASPPALWKQID